MWQDSFPNFNGTPGQEAILNRQSQTYALIRDFTVAADPKWETNGCTLVPDFDFKDCCDAHEICYCIGGDSAARIACDVALRQCIKDKGHTIRAWIYYRGVRDFGWAFFNYK